MLEALKTMNREYVEIKRPTRSNRLVSLLQNLLFAQYFSGTIMPIIRSSRFIQIFAACGTWRSSLQVVGLVWSCKPERQVPQAANICTNLELLMMGIMVPETCCVNNTFCSKETKLLYLVGLLISAYWRRCTVKLTPNLWTANLCTLYLKFSSYRIGNVHFIHYKVPSLKLLLK